MGEPRSVATTWHQIGMVHRLAGQYEQAEQAYRQSFAIAVQQRNVTDEAPSLIELGNLYNEMGRLEEAVRCYRQSADIYVRLRDQMNEGTARNNLANTLLKLRRYGEARAEVLRAIACKEPYGNAGEIWMAWHILYDLEMATGDEVASERARERAFESYLAYRRDGWYGTTQAARLCAMAAEAIQAGDTSELEHAFSQPLPDDAPPWARALFPKMLAVLRGGRDPVLAEDPELGYHGTVELLLLLESLREG